LEKGGDHKFTLYYIIDDGEKFGDSFSLKVRSYKEDTHFVVSYFHFNVQYKCGDPVVEERIINGSIRNLLDFYYEKPQYKFSFEIQGYAIEVMSRDYPDILVTIRELTERGQMELIITHYSDQFFIAYPELDLKKSIELSDDVLQRNNIRRSNVFGCQEWQWSPVLPEIMNEYGYTIFMGQDYVFKEITDYNESKGIYVPYEETCIWETAWNDDSVYIVLDKHAEIDRTDEDENKILFSKWAFHQDGELVNTRVYGNDFQFIEERQEDFEEDLETYEEEGYEFVTLSEFTYTALEKGLGAHQLDTIPCTAENDVFLWSGEKKNDYENDTDINTLRYGARTSLLTLETILDKADEYDINVSDEMLAILEKHDIDVWNEDNLITNLWRELFLAEVTDSTGKIPSEIEVEYSIEKATNIINACEEIVSITTEELDLESVVLIDTKKDKIYEEFQLPTYETTETPILFNVRADDYLYDCYKYSETLYLLEILVNPTDECSISFNVSQEDVSYSPLATDDYMNLEDFESIGLYFMLANGWIYLGNDTSIIKVCTTRHVSMRLKNQGVQFREENITETVYYQFFIHFGDKEDSLEFANRLNVRPCVTSDNITRVILTEEMISDFS
jgi:hypothetical protein